MLKVPNSRRPCWKCILIYCLFHLAKTCHLASLILNQAGYSFHKLQIKLMEPNVKNNFIKYVVQKKNAKYNPLPFLLDRIKSKSVLSKDARANLHAKHRRKRRRECGLFSRALHNLPWTLP